MKCVAASALSLGTILADYVTNNVPAAYPGAGIRHSLDGPGYIHRTTGAMPAAGAEIADAFPANARTKIIAALASLVSSATVATRVAAFVIDDGATPCWRHDGVYGQTATLTVSYSVYAGNDTLTQNNGTNHVALPLWAALPGGYRFRTQTAALQVGDQWAATNYLVEEWIDVG
jgi:hypothetical protein